MLGHNINSADQGTTESGLRNAGNQKCEKTKGYVCGFVLACMQETKIALLRSQFCDFVEKIL